jgi:serine/threonine protein kinase
VVQVVVANIDQETNTPWLVMEFLKGETLTESIEYRSAFSFFELREAFSQLAHALSAAHEVGVVHRDLKPDNLYYATRVAMACPSCLKCLILASQR